MKHTTTALAILLSLSSMSAVAAQDNDFQHEAGLEYNANSEDAGDGAWNAYYRYYFEGVDQGKSPYVLNGFLAQASNIGANYSNFDVIDSDTIGVDGTFVFDSNWFVSANYQRNEIGNFDFNTFGAEVGYYFNDSSAVSAFYQDGDSDVEDSYGLTLRSYIALQSTAGVDLQANWIHSDSDNMFNVGADWYVNNAWSVGAGYSDSKFFDGFDIRTAYWLRISDSFSASFEISKVLDSDADGVGFGIGVIGRF
ncbi:putative porin [Shewanella sp.]|uniref:putative porin n=1 Tax=Shewanella sp. TaxID=50422 RepID=UPI001EC526B4|nr:putative porin [Shewanella sp.]NRB23226.1 putative porin [Shewanella sp.]